MENFNVMIRFPKDKSGSVVTVTGLEENVEDAKEHLLLLAEEYVRESSCTVQPLLMTLSIAYTSI